MEPGDTVWWHGDMIHSVADDTTSERWGNVMYIPSAPYCEKNAAYAAACGQAFLSGAQPRATSRRRTTRSPGPDAATLADLSAVGRKQLGLEPW